MTKARSSSTKQTIVFTTMRGKEMLAAATVKSRLGMQITGRLFVMASEGSSSQLNSACAASRFCCS